MRNETFEELKDLAYELLTQNRFIGTEGHKAVKESFLLLLEGLGIKYRTEEFFVEKSVPKSAKLLVNNQEVPCVPYVNSPDCEVKALVKRDFMEKDIALCAQKDEMECIKKAVEKGCSAVITYLDDMDTNFYGTVGENPIAVVNIKKSYLPLVEDAEVFLKVSSSKERIKCSNVIFELGRGPVIYVVAHMDTKPEVHGAIDNGIGFLLLPFLYSELRRDYQLPYRIRFLATDAEEVGLEGAHHHVSKGIKHTYYCINIDSIGWSNPAVIYSDMEGPNGEKIMDMFYRHIRDIGVDMDFKASKRGRSDHIPFKKMGVECLFLSSNPFTIRHTFYDVVDAVDWDKVRMWFDVILSFLRRFHRL